jgi:hypothetical protein
MCAPRSGAHDRRMLNDSTLLEVLVNDRRRDLHRAGRKPDGAILERRARHHLTLRPWRRH